MVNRTGNTANNYLYQGEQYDSDLKLYYLRARYADPDRGRFWTQDSFEGFGTDPQSLHKYTFCQNNPINRLDPSGHMSLVEVMTVVVMSPVVRGALRTLLASFTTCSVTSAGWGALVGGGTGGLLSEAVTSAVDIFTGKQATNEELLQAFVDGAPSGALQGAACAFSPVTAGAYFAYTSYTAGLAFWKDWHDPSVSIWIKYLDAVNFVASLAPLVPGVARKLNEALQVCCFPAGTEVATEGGRKAIDKIQKGDLVWAQDDRSGEISLAPVKQIFVNVATALVVLHCGTNTLEATPEHPLWVVNEGWKPASQIQVGDELWNINSEPVSVTAIEHKQGQFTVYNFELANIHSYFAGDQRILVHNSCEDVWERNWRRIHDQYLQRIRPGAKEARFATPWSSSSGLGSRVYDDFDPITKTAYEANTTPWKDVSIEKMQHKLDQVGSDYALLKNGVVNRVVWFGTEALPTSGYGSRLRQALQDAGIEYQVIQ